MERQVASKIDPADKSTIEKAVDETVEWLDANQLAEVWNYSCSSPAPVRALHYHRLMSEF